MIKNSDLLREIALSKSRTPPRPTPALARMWVDLVENYARRPQWSGYSWVREGDFQAAALETLCRHGLKFNAERSQNPFAYYTQCCRNSFLRSLATQKRQTKIRDALLIENGLNPSWGYEDER